MLTNATRPNQFFEPDFLKLNPFYLTFFHPFFMAQSFFWTPKFFLRNQRNFLHPIFVDKNCFRLKTCFVLIFFVNLKCWAKTCWIQKICYDPIVFEPQILLSRKILSQKIFKVKKIWVKKFWVKKLLVPKHLGSKTN